MKHLNISKVLTDLKNNGHRFTDETIDVNKINQLSKRMTVNFKCSRDNCDLSFDMDLLLYPQLILKVSVDNQVVSIYYGKELDRVDVKGTLKASNYLCARLRNLT